MPSNSGEAESMGRKKVKTGERFDIRLRVDSGLHRRIQEAADQEGNSVAAFVRAAVVKELKARGFDEPPKKR